MSIHLVTGYAGKEHITSADQGSFNAGIIGKNKYILSTGNQFAAEIVSNNLVKIKDGDLVNQGRHIRIEANDYEECTIENGTQSRYRNDLIVARYSKNADTGIESMSIVVIKGTASTSSSPADPTYTSGDILNGALTDDFPLYRVRLNGLSITAVEPMFGDPVRNLSELNTDISVLGDFHIMTYSGTVSLNSNTYYGNLSFDLSDMIDMGYYPISVLRCTTGTAGALLYQFGFETSDGNPSSAQNLTRFVMRFRNPTSSAQTGTGSATILFAKINYTVGVVG